MFVYKVILFMFYLGSSQCRTPEKVYCVNKDCSEPISKAKTLVTYHRGDSDTISFRGNADALVYMKSADTNSDLWYVEINKQFGFVSSKFLRETKVFVKHPEIINPVEVRKNPNTPDVQPDKVRQSHEVIEGTTIYTTEATTSEQSTMTEIPNAESARKLDEGQGLSNNSDTIATFEHNNDQNFSEQSVTNIDENSSEKNPLESSNEAIQVDPPSSETKSEDPSVNPPPNEANVIVESEKNDNMQDEVLANKSIETVPQKLIPLNSENNEVPINSDSIQNTTPQTILSDSSEINSSLPLNSVESAGGNNQDVTESPAVLSNDSEQSQPEKVKEVVQSPLVENKGIISSFFSPEPNPAAIEKLNEVNKPTESTPHKEQVTEAQSQPEEAKEVVQPPLVENKGIISSFFSQEPTPTASEKVDEPTEPTPLKEQVTEVNLSSEINKQLNEINQPNHQNFAPMPNEQTNDLNNQIENNDKIYKEFYSEESIDNKKEAYLPNDPVVSDSITTSEETKVDNQNNLELSQSNENLINTPNENLINRPKENTKPLSPALETQVIPETIPASISPIVDTIPVHSQPGQVPHISENHQPDEIPPIYQEPQTMESLPPIFSNPMTQIEESVNTDSYASSNIPEIEEPTINPNHADSYTTNSPPLEDIYNSDSQFTENANEVLSETSEENSESFLSSMYTTLIDVWPSPTEAPPSLFNKDIYPTPEEEKADGKAGFSLMSYIMSMYYSVMGVDDNIKALFTSDEKNCQSGECCDGKGEQSNRFLTFLVTAASSVVLFTLGYYYLDNKRQDGQLIGKINSLQRDLLFSTKECEILKEELSSTKTKLAGIEDSSFGMDDMVQSLREEIDELKATNERLRNSLDDNEKLLRVSENTAGELQNTLGEVENTLSELLAERANSEEQINELNGKIQAFEEEFISVSRERDNYQLKYVSAETALEEAKKYKKQLDDINLQLTEAKNTIELQKHEITALKDAMRELKSGGGANVDVASLIDHTAIKAQLSKALEENKLLSTQFEVEQAERKRLSDELQSTQESLRTSSQQATEATTRLEVLGKYFQEREGELLKELSAKESLYLSKQGESVSTVEKIELMQQEVQRYKEKCEALTLELAEQETTRRTAVSEVEARAHGAWLEARAARREADAARDEAAALRRKLNTHQHNTVTGGIRPSPATRPSRATRPRRCATRPSRATRPADWTPTRRARGGGRETGTLKDEGRALGTAPPTRRLNTTRTAPRESRADDARTPHIQEVPDQDIHRDRINDFCSFILQVARSKNVNIYSL